MNKRKFEDIIAEQGRLIYTAEGDSMFPLIRPRDLLVIDAVKKPLAVNDVPLYKRDNGQYVLHRIVKIKRGKYVMKGDNRAECETGIRDRHIIGVLTAVIRDGKTLPVEAPKNQSSYVAKHMALYPLRLIYRPIKSALTRPGKVIGEYKKVKTFRKKIRKAL